MRFAKEFQCPDVDAFLESVTAEQYADWQQFYLREPWGWPAKQMEVERLTWAVFQRGRKEQVPVIPFRTKADAPVVSEKLKRIRDEMDNAVFDAIAAASGTHATASDITEVPNLPSSGVGTSRDDCGQRP